MYYVIFYPNGSVIDQFKFPHTDEQDFIGEHVQDGAVKIIRRRDGVVVYEKEPS